MVSANICQIAYLNARIHKVSRVIFTGNFLRQNPVARESITTNMRTVSKAHHEEPFEALFLKHEGYFGALGTFLHNVIGEDHGALASRRMTSLSQPAAEPPTLLARWRQRLPVAKA